MVAKSRAAYFREYRKRNPMPRQEVVPTTVTSVRLKLEMKARWKEIAGNQSLNGFIIDAVEDYIESLADRKMTA